MHSHIAPGFLMCDAIADAIVRLDQQLALEQAPSGVDTRTELQLHETIADALRSDLCGWTVIREQPLPGKPLSGSRITDRERCDIVLVPAGATSIADPEHVRRERAGLAATLFAESSLVEETTHGRADPRECVWLEIKLARAWTTGDHGVRPNPAWTRELVELPILDVEKLATDPCIDLAHVAILAFGPDEQTVQHDLHIALSRAIDRGVPVTSPISRGVPLTDRIGNAHCSVTLWPVAAHADRFQH